MKVEALTYVWDGLHRGESVVFAHKDNIIMVSVSSFSSDDQIRKDTAQILSAVNLY